MDRMLRKSFCVGLLLSGSMVFAQEPARINGAQALRFQQGSGFSNYVAFCVTPKEFMAHVPPAKLPPDNLEYALCWYVNGTMSHGSAVSSAVEGRLVISANHVRFVPSDPKSADTYADLHPEKVELKHDSGQPYGIVQASDAAFRFQFSKLCPSCPSGAAAPADVDAEITDKEFALLEENIRHFYSGWKQIYRLSSGKAAEPVSRRLRPFRRDLSNHAPAGHRSRPCLPRLSMLARRAHRDRRQPLRPAHPRRRGPRRRLQARAQKPGQSKSLRERPAGCW